MSQTPYLKLVAYNGQLINQRYVNVSNHRSKITSSRYENRTQIGIWCQSNLWSPVRRRQAMRIVRKFRF